MKSKKVKTKVVSALDGWTVRFSIGVQTFSLASVDSKEMAKWYQNNLDTAFANLQNKGAEDKA